MSLDIANILKGFGEKDDKPVTFVAEILKCGNIQSYKTRNGELFYFLAVLADSSCEKPVIMKSVHKDMATATEKRQMFSKRPLHMYINNVYVKNGPFILAIGSSHFFPINRK